jgi:hypothetical protein
VLLWSQYGSVNNLWRLKPLLDKQSPPTRTNLTVYNDAMEVTRLLIKVRGSTPKSLRVAAAEMAA